MQQVIEHWQIPVIHTSSNAQSALEAKKTPNAGAILSSCRPRIYQIPVIGRNVENNPENTTRFVTDIKNTQARTAGPASAASSSTRTPTGPGRSMTSSESLPGGDQPDRIESRPTKRGMGTYVFFLDYAVTGQTDEALRTHGDYHGPNWAATRNRGTAMIVTLPQRHGIDITVAAPPSKSYTHRALIAAALARVRARSSTRLSLMTRTHDGRAPQARRPA